MSNSKRHWLGFWIVLPLVGLSIAVLLACWPTPTQIAADAVAALSRLRWGSGLAMLLLTVAFLGSAAMAWRPRRASVVNPERVLGVDEQFRESAEASGFGAYAFDLDSRTPHWTPNLKELWGLPADSEVTWERLVQAVHPRDRELFQQRMTGKFVGHAGGKYESDFRVVLEEGEIRWLHDCGQFVMDGEDRSRRPVRCRGLISDITLQKHEHELDSESELRHRAAFENSAVGMCQADAVTGQLLRFNSRFCQILGASSSDLVNLPIQEIVHPDDRSSVLDGLDRLRREEIKELHCEARFLRGDHELNWGDITVNCARSSSQRLRLVAVIKDVTERKQAEAKVRAAERQLRAFLNNSAVCGWMKDDEGRYVFLSENHQRHFGGEFAQWQNKTDFDLWPREVADTFRANDQAVLETGQTVEVLEEVLLLNGQHSWWLCHKFPYQDESGKRFVGGLGVDVTEHKRIESELRQSEQRLSLVIQGVNVGLFDWWVGSDVVRYSREWKSQLGYAEDEIADRFSEWQSRVHPDDLESTLTQTRQYLERPWPGYEAEFRMRHKDGSWRWILARAALVNDSTGKPSRMIGIHLDITARKEAEETLRESEERLRLANDAAGIGTFIVDIPANSVRYSPELCEMLGVPFGMDRTLEDVFQFVQPEDLARVRTGFNAALNPFRDGMQRTEHRVVRPSGETRWLLTNGQVEFQETPTGRTAIRFVGACLDITERKRSEESLRRLNEDLEQRVAERTRVLYAKQERLQAILNNNFNAVITCDQQARIESVNLAAVAMFGCSVDEMLGEELHRFVPQSPSPLQVNASRDDVGTLLAQLTGLRVEVLGHRKDGSTFPADLAVSEIAHLGLFCVILRDLSEEKRLEREVAEAAEGEQRRIGQDLHDSVGQQLMAMAMVAQDFVERLGTSETLDAAISDPNLVESPVPSLSRLTPVALAERLRRDLQKTLEEVRSISRSLNPVPVDSQGLTAALADLADQMGSQSRVQVTFSCESPVHLEDNVVATHLFHIAQEAMNNSVRHSDAQKVCIKLRQEELQIVLTVQDDGQGIYRSSSQREGLGLRIMKNRADIIGATLTIDRAKPHGTLVACVLSNGTKVGL